MKKIVILLMIAGQLQGAVFTVINTNDTGAGSLRQAVLDANSAGGNSTIQFNIPGAAPQIIVPASYNSVTPPRAQIYQPLTHNAIIIDGTTQPGYVFGAPSIIIDCRALILANPLSGSCFFIQGANNCVFKGIGICNYSGSINGAGISIENTATQGAANNQITECELGSIAIAPPFGNTRGILMTTRFTPTGSNLVLNNIIGGPAATDGNILSGNSVAGIQLQLGASSTTIENNFVGCDVTGTVVIPNGEGIVLLGSQTGAGQSGPCDNNIIQNNVVSGNQDVGIDLQGNANNNTIQNNKIGTDITGSVLLGATAGPGITLQGDATDTCNNNIIQNNVIGGNQYGITVTSNSSSNQITSNYIGTNSDEANLGNTASGILIQGATGLPCSQNSITLNTIQFNGNGVGAPDFYGIYLDGDATTPDILNAMLENAISNNNNNGIELANNSNDNQAPPTITSAGACSSGTQSSIVVNVTAPTVPAASNFRLDFYVNTVNRNPITEGARFVGSIPSVASGASVSATFAMATPPVTSGDFITATATNLNNAGGPGDTSEYSLNGTIGALTSPTITSISALPTAICTGSSSTITVSFVQGTSSGPFTATWSDGTVQAGVVSPFTHNVSPTVSTNYTVTLTDGLSCSVVSSPVTVTVGGPAITLTASSNSIQSGQSVTLTATPSGTAPFTLVWSDGLIQMGVTGATQRVVNPTVTTTYRVTAIDANGCESDPSAGVQIIIGGISPIAQAILEKYCPNA